LNSAPLDIICSVEEKGVSAGDKIVFLSPDRATLAKRRWRGVAQDGREFGFDLDHPLSNGSVFFREPGTCYVISQAPEPVLEIALDQDPKRAAALAWQIGNLHFPIEVTDSVIRCPDDPAIRQMLQREQIASRAAMAVFRPITSPGHAHHH
jgi:urease accessory protein